jgi:membrane protein DedA with SNARE-associated domain
MHGVLAAYGSVLILPLSVIEGPVVSAATGFMSAQGYVRWYTAIGLLVAGDLIGDLMYYAIGYTGAGPLGWLGRRLGLHGTVSPELRRGLVENSAKMLLIGKWTHSIGFVVLIGSGMLRLPLPRFLIVNLIAAVPKIAVLFGCGYFAGDHYPFLERHYMITLLLLAALGGTATAFVLRQAGHAMAPRPDP